MKIGLIGGSFDPIHLGHLNAAEEITEILHLDKMIFMPAYSPPHKRRRLASAEHRFNMAQKAVNSNPRFEVSDLEIKRGGLSYTIDTVRETRKRFGGDAELFFVLGTDAILELGEWKEAENLFFECHFVVALRPGFEGNAIIDVLRKTLPERGGKEMDFSLEKGALEKGDRIDLAGSPFSIFLLSTTALDISSTEVRNRLGKGKSIRYMVPEMVQCYIVKKGLYGRSQSPTEENH